MSDSTARTVNGKAGVAARYCPPRNLERRRTIVAFIRDAGDRR